MDNRTNSRMPGVHPIAVKAEDLQPRFAYGRDGKALRIVTLNAPPELTPRGVCVLLHGQTEFIEKYLEVIGELLARGYTVATMDWRGQGGSVRALGNPLKAHIADFSQYISDLQVFLDKVVHNLTDRPPIALAHSMGAHILLRSLHERPKQFSAAVLVAPMLRVLTREHSPRFVRWVSRMQNMLGRQEDWIFDMQTRDPLRATFADQIATSDAQRFQRTQEMLRAHPNLRLTGPTWGWLEAAYRSMDKTAARGFVEAIATPLLVFGAGRDRIVDNAAVRAFTQRLPNRRYEEIGEAEHEILMESDAIRARFWEAFDRFALEHI
jgi:lysophospholipase